MKNPNDIVERFSGMVFKNEEEAKAFLQDEITGYGRGLKAAGAAGLARQVEEMRDAQKRYFQTRSKEALRESKALEEQVDRSVKLILKIRKEGK